MRPARILTVTFVLLVTLGCSGASETGTSAGDVADTVYTNGKIYTVNEAQPWAEVHSRVVVLVSVLTPNTSPDIISMS